MPQDTAQRRTLVNTILNIGSNKKREFLKQHSSYQRIKEDPWYGISIRYICVTKH
jgi:hypothetical protein